MIILCENCSRKFIAKDSDIPKEGRMVQCGYCSVTWHQMPVSAPTKILRQKNINEPTKEKTRPRIATMNNRLAFFLGSDPQKTLDAGFHGLPEASSTLL